MEEIPEIESAEKPRILVVDDEITLLRLLKINLTKNGYEIITASTGVEALKIIEKDPNFDLILLDIMMPEMSGYQVCRILREKYSLYELPIIFVTAKFQVHDIIEGFDIGANDYILKPFDFKELLARSRTLIKLKKLTQANKLLQEVKELSDNFHMMTIHDLKNPLTSILIRTEFIKRQLDYDSPHFEHLEAISKSSNVMLEQINDFVEISRIGSGKIVLEKTKIDLNKVVLGVINNNLSNAENKKQELRFSPGLPERSYVYADESKIIRIVDNLINNAIKYSNIDTVIEINISSIGDLIKGQFVRFSVKDQGPGLSDEDIKLAFNKFQKLSARPTGGEASSGLGLSIAKDLIEMHNGKIRIESVPGEGCTFIFELPAAMY